MLANPFNWLPTLRAAWIFRNPLQFAFAVLMRQAPEHIVVRSPLGAVKVGLRNFESLRTAFSIFCRRDYLTATDRGALFVDVGANIGIASLYFLTRNACNRVLCFEPDAANLEHLRANLQPFGSRAMIVTHAVGIEAGTMTLYRSEDGKYSSMIPSQRASQPQETIVDAFDEILRRASAENLPVVVKLDVEGLETELVKHTDFSRHLRVERLICESTECARHVQRSHRRIVRNGYIEDVQFVST